jgi:glycosyltransferase involved in cell wall biosynthesis
MKILFIPGREPTYVRNAIIYKALQKNGAEILDCSDSSACYPTRYVKVLSKFILKRKNNFDLVFVGFFGQPLVPIIKKLTSKPIILDAFLSAYDTMCFDRKRFKPNSLMGNFFYWLDKYSCNNSDRVLLDTSAHIDYFVKTFGLQKDKFQRIFVGADESLFYPREVNREDNRFRVFYYASYLPLHGTEYIVQAAKLLERNWDIGFTIIGKGPQLKNIRQLARRIGIVNVDFIDWIPYEDLPFEIAKADICLGGHFSGSGKSKRVIAGKTYQFIAMKKPVIVGDCPANRELFTHGKSAFMVNMADAESLANGVLELKNNEPLRRGIAEEGYNIFMAKCTIDAIARELKGIFRIVR